MKFFTPKARPEVKPLILNSEPVPLPFGGGSHFLWEVLNGFGVDFDPRFWV